MEDFMTAFLALYQGETINSAKVVAVTAEQGIVTDFSRRLLGEPDEDRRPELHLVENDKKKAESTTNSATSKRPPLPKEYINGSTG